MTAPAISPVEAPAMQMPRFRFTVRRMMVAVAFAGLVLAPAAWGIRLLGYAEGFRRQSARMQARERRDFMACRYWRDAAETNRALGVAAEKERANAAHFERLAGYCGSLSRKYERAARYPWLPVEPDPPEPE
jgi:hypothetical protein